MRPSPILFFFPLSTLTSAANLLFGPLTLSPNLQISNINIINFQDEVLDISSISIFGNVNDGGACEQSSPQEARQSGNPLVLGPKTAER